MLNRVLFRADASTEIGSGHVMRCVTLAEALKKSGATVEFASCTLPGDMNEWIREKGFPLHQLQLHNGSEITDSQGDIGRPSKSRAWPSTNQEIDAGQVNNIMGPREIDWLIVDHYGLDEVWERLLRRHVHKIMVIDDMANRAHECDVLLDQNYFKSADSRYQQLVPPACTQLLGPRYALLRKEFLKLRGKRRSCEAEIRRVLISFGGTDSHNVTSKVLSALSSREFAHLDVDVIIGLGNPNREGIAGQVDARPNTRLHVQTDNVAQLMAKADLAIGAGGATTWERLCLGLPSLVVTTAENQEETIRDLQSINALKWLGRAREVERHQIIAHLTEILNNPDGQRAGIDTFTNLVDGAGTDRVMRFIQFGPSPDSLTVRQAELADCALFWIWANDPVVRQQSFNPEPISYENHQEWFETKVRNEDSIFLVVESCTGPLGQVRFDLNEGHAVINYSIARQFRGLGLGSKLLEMCICAFRDDHKIDLVANVKASNPASLKIFRELGFEERNNADQHQHCFTLSISSKLQISNRLT